MMVARRMRAAAGAAMLVLAAGCRPEGADPAAGQDTAAAGDSVRWTCHIDDPEIPLPGEVSEPSGAAMDPRLPGVFWSHGDSGRPPTLYALGNDGQLLGRVRVLGARNRDWEDMAIGPCPGGTCVYIGDVGNNRGVQRELVLYRVPLPQPGDSATARAEVFRARYPAGGHDTEAMFVTSAGEVYLINKGQRSTVDLWRWPTPLRPGPVHLVHVRQLTPHPRQPGDYVTGAGASRDGRWVAVRTYGRLALYRTADLLGSGEPAFAMDLAPLGEPQGEGVAMDSDGTVLLTSESRERTDAGRAAWLQCALPAS